MAELKEVSLKSLHTPIIVPSPALSCAYLLKVCPTGSSPAGTKNCTKASLTTTGWGTLENKSFYNPQIEMFARFKMKSSFHKTKRII